MAHLNFLEPHLEAVFRFIGMTDISFVRVGCEEFKDERFQRSLAAAENAVDRLAGLEVAAQTEANSGMPVLA